MTRSRLVDRLLTIAQKVPLPFWLAVMLLVPIGVAGWGLWSLNQRDVQDCATVKNPATVADSTLLYCAQVLAARPEPSDLVQAIEFANAIAPDHPLRPDSDHLIERWSSQLFDTAETQFQDGKLTDAIALVDKIPLGTATYAKAQPKKHEWQTIWADAEAIYADAEAALQDDQPTVAIAEARKLRKVKNQYWQTTRFQALVIEIQTVRENQKKTAKKQPPPNPSALPASTTDDLLSQWDKEQAAEAKVYLAKAQEQASQGTLQGLREAIASAEMIFSGTPQYPQAQQLIETWTRQIETIEDRPYLDRAIQLASKGDMASLQAAISEANNIYFGRALYQTAQAKIDQWTTQVRQLHELQYAPPSPTALPSNQFNDRDRTPNYR